MQEKGSGEYTAAVATHLVLAEVAQAKSISFP